MPFLAFVAGSALTPPNLAEYATPQDYPFWAHSNERSAASLIKVIIDPKGRTVKCENLVTYGDARLSGEICKIVSRRRIRPATFRDGRRAYFIVDTLVKFLIPGTLVGDKIVALRQQPDLELTVNRLPGTSPVADVKLVLAVDGHGAVADCGADRKERQLALVNAVCSKLTTMQRMAHTDAEGQPISYVTTMMVRLYVGGPQQVPAKTD